jgi:hypothetical protein
MIAGEQKDTYLGVLDRIQAFEICGEGVDHEDFMLSLGKEAKALRRCLTLRDPTCFNEQVKKINVMLDERLTRYGTFIHSEIASFIIERRNVQAIEEEDISEINSNIARSNESLEEMFGHICNNLDSMNSRFDVNEKRFSMLERRLSILGKHLKIHGLQTQDFAAPEICGSKDIQPDVHNVAVGKYRPKKGTDVGDIFRCVPHGDFCTESAISKILNLDEDTVYHNLRNLCIRNIVARVDDKNGTRQYTRLVDDDSIDGIDKVSTVVPSV